jgi:hypothetical protein
LENPIKVSGVSPAKELQNEKRFEKDAQKNVGYF